jgi:hypothetical protein
VTDLDLCALASSFPATAARIRSSRAPVCFRVPLRLPLFFSVALLVSAQGRWSFHRMLLARPVPLKLGVTQHGGSTRPTPGEEPHNSNAAPAHRASFHSVVTSEAAGHRKPPARRAASTAPSALSKTAHASKRLESLVPQKRAALVAGSCGVEGAAPLVKRPADSSAPPRAAVPATANSRGAAPDPAHSWAATADASARVPVPSRPAIGLVLFAAPRAFIAPAGAGALAPLVSFDPPPQLVPSATPLQLDASARPEKLDASARLEKLDASAPGVAASPARGRARPSLVPKERAALAASAAFALASAGCPAGPPSTPLPLVEDLGRPATALSAGILGTRATVTLLAALIHDRFCRSAPVFWAESDQGIHPRLLVFRCETVPDPIDIRHFLRRILVYSLISPEALVCSILLLERVHDRLANFPIDALTIHRLRPTTTTDWTMPDGPRWAVCRPPSSTRSSSSLRVCATGTFSSRSPSTCGSTCPSSPSAPLPQRRRPAFCSKASFARTPPRRAHPHPVAGQAPRRDAPPHRRP